MVGRDVRRELWLCCRFRFLSADVIATLSPAFLEEHKIPPLAVLQGVTARALAHNLTPGAGRGASAEAVAVVLRDNGIESNRIHGKWTGVSLARYRKLVDVIASNSRAAAPILAFVPAAT